MSHLITLNRQEVWKLNILPKSWNSSSRSPSCPLTCEKKLGHGLAASFEHKQDFEPWEERVNFEMDQVYAIWYYMPIQEQL